MEGKDASTLARDNYKEERQSMKKLILLIAILSLLLCACVGPGDSDFIIEVSGTSGLQFSGSYMSVTSGGQSTSRSVDGIVPAQYSISGYIVSCAFQKKSEGGTLKVRILKDGKVVSYSETSATYGVVSVATP